MIEGIPKIPVKYNFELLRGTDYTCQFLIKDCENNRVSLRSYWLKIQLKKGFNSNVIDELSSQNLRIKNTSSEDDEVYDLITFTLDHEHTADYPLGVLLYDLRIESREGFYTKIIEGQIRCLANVTQ